MSNEGNTALGVSDDAGNNSKEATDLLHVIRSKSAYSALRGFIAFFSIAGILIGVLGALTCVVVGLMNANLPLVFGGAGGGFVVCIVAIITKDSASLLIDIADILIQGRANKNF